MTAQNPHGQRMGTEQNARAEAALRALVRTMGRTVIPVVNGEGGWAEAALLIGEIRLADAIVLGRQFEQAAVLWGTGRRVALVHLRPLRIRRFWTCLLAG